ncbi:MAG: hypothetical protein JWR19_2207 [Pedosphaera sp.]|nr:hypothetical protein [Pedosphaera sp.]
MPEIPLTLQSLASPITTNPMSASTKTESPDLDDMLLPDEAAKWLRVTPRVLSEKSQGLKPEIPVFKSGQKVRRYHPRTIIAAMARNAGVPLETIAASFGMLEKGKQ